MPLPDSVAELITRFDDNRASYQAAAYNEAQTRQEFINPLFAALGWDVDNTQGFAEAYKDVVHEDAIKIGGVMKAPDYSFRIGGTRKFFLEAKKPSVIIQFEKSAAFQLRRYAWSAKLPLSILTNFAELAVYDCRFEPDKADQPSKARLFHFSCKDYAEKWDEIAAIFSKNAILKGSFDGFAESSKGKRGTAEVDAAFLAQIEAWRDLLARNLALRNPGLSQRDLNFAVQRTIDRIVFLRICEDRGMESYGALQALQNGTHCYARLCELFRAADDRYNSGLFHFASDKARPEEPDGLTLGLGIDDKTLKDILRGLYYPDSPYVFSVIPADILGQAYEQFLGKVIRLTTGHRAVIEDKPEVKKAGGVYYTPTYIVDYIVKNTLGKLLDGKTPGEAAKLRVLDPACGSGSFLLGAFQFLLDWHRDWYVANGGPTKHKKELYEGPGGLAQLTAQERKRILRGSIFGVDIDAQAVEVTKLSLLLKVLEGESVETLNSNLKLFQERALPDLGDNIKCGNSLIGPDFYELPQAAALSGNELLRINPFDWAAEFPKIMQGGGFDAVIGNPPWVSAWTGSEELRIYLNQNYNTLVGHWDTYLAFLVRTLKLLNKTGIHSCIYPSSILSESYAKKVRQEIIEGKLLSRLAIFGLDKVFAKVSRKVCILELSHNSTETIVDEWSSGHVTKTFKENTGPWLHNHNYLFSPSNSSTSDSIRMKIEDLSVYVGDLYYVNYGAQISSKVKGAFSQDKLLTMNVTGNAKKCLRGTSVKRYSIKWDGSYLNYQPEIMYGPRLPIFFESPKIIVNKISSKGYRLLATYDNENYYCDQRLICLVRYSYLEASKLKLDFQGFQRRNFSESEFYHTGILNSSLLSYWFVQFIATKNLQGDYTDVLPKMVRSLPIRTINFADPADKARHDKTVELVEKMLQLQRALPGKMGQEKTVMERQMAATDAQIDKLVYDLYGLTPEEIAVVEGAA